MKDRKNSLSVIILLSVACALFVACAGVWNLFGQTDTLSVIKVIADCFTLPGALYVGVALLGWAGSKGTFDIFGYSIGGLFYLFKREAYSKRRETFYDYRVKKDKDRKPFNLAMFLVGLAFLLLALVFTLVFAALE